MAVPVVVAVAVIAVAAAVVAVVAVVVQDDFGYLAQRLLEFCRLIVKRYNII
jgi:hypothetical protein